jgi:hypothetical protein
MWSRAIGGVTAHRHAARASYFSPGGNRDAAQ